MSEVAGGFVGLMYLQVLYLMIAAFCVLSVIFLSCIVCS
jgi:hypothetical protein